MAKKEARMIHLTILPFYNVISIVLGLGIVGKGNTYIRIPKAISSIAPIVPIDVVFAKVSF
jgi:hypothetical protein